MLKKLHNHSTDLTNAKKMPFIYNARLAQCRAASASAAAAKFLDGSKAGTRCVQMRRAMCNYQYDSTAATKRIRVYLTQKISLNAFEKRNRAAICIQRAWRAYKHVYAMCLWDVGVAHYRVRVCFNPQNI
jgi:hypothetical protein